MDLIQRHGYVLVPWGVLHCSGDKWVIHEYMNMTLWKERRNVVEKNKNKKKRKKDKKEEEFLVFHYHIYSQKKLCVPVFSYKT